MPTLVELPNPEALAQLAALNREDANRVLALAEREEAHRQRTEWELLQHDIRQATRGMWMGFVVALLGLGIACALTLAGPPVGGPVAGTVIGTVDLTSLVALFVLGQRRVARS